jgi:hypothetical protein
MDSVRVFDKAYAAGKIVKAGRIVNSGQRTVCKMHDELEEKDGKE